MTEYTVEWRYFNMTEPVGCENTENWSRALELFDFYRTFYGEVAIFVPELYTYPDGTGVIEYVPIREYVIGNGVIRYD